MDTLPKHLVRTGPYAYTRNPIYLGHMIFLLGLTLFLKSFLAAFLMIVLIFYYRSRVNGDEKRLVGLFGESYAGYKATVKRWIPGLF
jgi:protein-S-isoprenylcysteine O-methyltransferase Ste14